MLKKIITVIVTVQLLFLNVFSNAAPVHAMLEFDDGDRSTSAVAYAHSPAGPFLRH